MKKFEHKLLGVNGHHDPRFTAKQLTDIGAEGWEAVCMLTPVLLLLKREIVEVETLERKKPGPKPKAPEPVAA